MMSTLTCTTPVYYISILTNDELSVHSPKSLNYEHTAFLKTPQMKKSESQCKLWSSWHGTKAKEGVVPQAMLRKYCVDILFVVCVR